MNTLKHCNKRVTKLEEQKRRTLTQVTTLQNVAVASTTLLSHRRCGLRVVSFNLRRNIPDCSNSSRVGPELVTYVF